MHRSQDVLTDYTLIQHNGILVVVTFPRHVSHQQVLAQCQFAIFRRVTFSQNLSLSYTLAFFTNGTKVNRHILIGTTPLRDVVFLQSRFKAYELFVFRAVVQDTDSRSIHKVDHAIAFCSDLRAGIMCQLAFNACTHNRRLASQQWNSLTHHVRTHQGTVGIIMLQEGNQ